jgi:hypothetical protein
VRKYGFPNFEQIFGKRELEHGVEDDHEPAKPEGTPASGTVAPASQDAPKSDESKATARK